MEIFHCRKWGDAMLSKGISISLTGFLVVFGVLLILYCFALLLSMLQNKEEGLKPETTFPPEIYGQTTEGKCIDQQCEEVAAITAALVEKLNHNNFRINKIIKTVSQEKPQWNYASWDDYFHRGAREGSKYEEV